MGIYGYKSELISNEFDLVKTSLFQPILDYTELHKREKIKW